MYLGGNHRWVPLISLVFNLSGRCTLITFFRARRRFIGKK